jgi:anaerobic magnesium-protoporphyrin IX monomethyl ester cyclase
MLNAMRKGTTVEQNAKAIRLAKKAGISVTISVIIGYPGETMDTLQQTLDFIRKTEPDDVHMSLATPYPGIELYNVVKKLGWKMCEDWSHCDMQASVFENPLLPLDFKETRKRFYNHFYSPAYILRQAIKRNFYSQIMARAALNQLLWRIRAAIRFSS